MSKKTSQSYAESLNISEIGEKYVYLFAEGDGKNKQLLGGKGAGLCEMTQIGLPVPPGFVITTQACLEYFEQDFKLPKGLTGQVREAMEQIEKAMRPRFRKPSTASFSFSKKWRICIHARNDGYRAKFRY